MQQSCEMPGWMKLKLESRWPGEISTTSDRQMRYTFPGSSAGKESACNAGDPGSIPGLERSAGEVIGYPLQYSWACLGSSAGKESACNAEDSDLIPGLGRSLREGIGYPLQYSWAPVVTQTEKNPPAMQETLVQFLGWKDLLEKGKTTNSSVLAWRISWAI